VGVKNLVSVLTAVIMLSFPLFADSEYTCRELQNKFSGFSRMEKGGNSLLIGGISLMTVGTVGLITAIPLLIDDREEGLIGIIVAEYGFTFGIPMTVVGGVLKGIGGKKRKEYKRRLCLFIQPTGAAISYSF
jgi:hypothetical protein